MLFLLALVLAGQLRHPSAEASLSPGNPDDDSPQVVSLEPENRAEDLDVKKVTRLVVTFDRAMSNTGWSLCGGGPTFPAIKGTPRWDTPKKLVVDVELEPDHQYHLSLNCPSATNFRSAEGEPLAPVSWSFSTAPDKLPNQTRQKKENRKALEALQEVLESSYSYYDLRVHSWDKVIREHQPAIVGAKTARGWASEAAKMLAVAEDLHLYLRIGDRTFATGTRSVDSLYRRDLLGQYLSVEPAGQSGLQGRTSDGIGYLMIPAWGNADAITAVEQALAGLRDCRALILDVRPNSGGDELLAQRIAAWFVEGTKVYGKNRYREKKGKNGFGPVFDRIVTGNADTKKQISTPIVVLTSRYVMSSNESFVLMMRQAPDCTVVGERTFGSSGNPKPHELPNGVTVVLPSWQDMRPDETCFEGEGLAPDVEVVVKPEDLESKDPILERALVVLREKIR